MVDANAYDTHQLAITKTGFGDGVQDFGDGVQDFGDGVQGFGEEVQGFGEEVQGFGDALRTIYGFWLLLAKPLRLHSALQPPTSNSAVIEAVGAAANASWGIYMGTLKEICCSSS